MRGNQAKNIFTSLLVLMLVFSSFVPTMAYAAVDQTPSTSKGTQNERIIEQQAAIAEQLKLTNSGPTLHKSLSGRADTEEVNVIVHLSEKPVALQKGIAELKGENFTASEERKVKSAVAIQQNLVFKELSVKKVHVQKGYTFDTVLNGFSAKIKAKDLKKLLSIKGVTLVEPDTAVYAAEVPASDVSAAMGTSNSFLGIEKIWNEGIEGQGVKVAVLDTGIDTQHPAFQGVYKGGKNFVVHDEEYARPRLDNDPSETSPLDRAESSPEVLNGLTFNTTHGTHVAGTIAANGENPYGVKGIAPKVDLYAYRVLGAYGAGTSASVIKAIDESVKEKMDIINLSLSTQSNNENSAISYAINNAVFAGVIAVNAAGNNGPGRGSLGSPASSRLAIAVGNTTNPSSLYDAQVTVKSGGFELSRNANVIATTYGTKLANLLTGEFPIAAIPGVGLSEDYEGMNVEGKVVLIPRGGVSLQDKVEIAYAHGAVAVLLYNNAAGLITSVLGDEIQFVPTFTFSQADGKAIATALKSNEGTVTFSSFNETVIPGDEVNSSSSRGPSAPNFEIKPDVLAPGTNIMSTLPMYQADIPEAIYDYAYGRKTGTSMATPHIAGIAALMKQAHPEWTPYDVKVALSNTAKVIDKKYDVFSQGAGRVQAYEAVHPTILAYVKDAAVLDDTGVFVNNFKGTLAFGPQSLKNDLSVTKQILVKDVKGLRGKYKVTVDVTKAFPDTTVTVDKPIFSFDKNGEQLLTVTLTAAQNLDTKANDEILGFIHITTAEEQSEVTTLTANKTELNLQTGSQAQLTVTETKALVDNEYVDISLPFAADFSDGAEEIPEIQSLSLSETDVSFNGDGVQDEAILYTTIVGEVSFVSFDLYDMFSLEPLMYHYEDFLDGGFYEFLIQSPFDLMGEQLTIPDGVYSVEVSGVSKNNFLWNSVEPLFVKSTNPIINGTVIGTTVSGQITDQYIDFIANLEMIYSETIDLNEKLHATYTITKNGVPSAEVPFLLEQDGSFNLALDTFNPESDSVTVTIMDAAGNVGETVLDNLPVVMDSVVQDEVVENEITYDKASIVSGVSKNSAIESSPQPFVSGTKDVTKEATYVIADEAIVSVTEGAVTAKSQGTTTIMIKYGEEEVTVHVTVTDPIVILPEIPGPSNPTPVEPKPEEPKPVTPPVFNDIKNTFAAKEINALATKGIIQGKTENNFAPNAQITRAEFAVLIARALDLPVEEYTGKFADVNTSKKWAFAAVEAAARAGIVQGTADGKFNPDAPIKREEIATMVVRAISYQDKAKLDSLVPVANFTDHGSIGTFAIEAVYKANALGVVKGDKDHFKPKNNATRAEAAAMLYRALDVLSLLD